MTLVVVSIRDLLFSTKKNIYAGNRSTAALCGRLWVQVKNGVATVQTTVLRENTSPNLVPRFILLAIQNINFLRTLHTSYYDYLTTRQVERNESRAHHVVIMRILKTSIYWRAPTDSLCELCRPLQRESYAILLMTYTVFATQTILQKAPPWLTGGTKLLTYTYEVTYKFIQLGQQRTHTH